MRCTEQDVERVAKAIYKADPCFHTHNGVDWEPSDFYSDDLEDHWREIARKQARAALEAMQLESLEDVLEPDNVTDVHLMWCRTGDDEGEWRAFLNRDQIVSAERTWFGKGSTIDEAVRNAASGARESVAPEAVDRGPVVLVYVDLLNRLTRVAEAGFRWWEAWADEGDYDGEYKHMDREERIEHILCHDLLLALDALSPDYFDGLTGKPKYDVADVQAYERRGSKDD